jgi:ComF family protein
MLIVSEPHCRACGHPFWGEAGADQVCPHCCELLPVFRKGKTAALMQGPARTLIHELKYKRGLYVIPDLKRIAERAPGYLEFLSGACLVPVPLHPMRRIRRGFNQSLLLIRELSRDLPDTTVADLLVRRRNTQTQTRLRRSERQKNMAGAFGMKKQVPLDPAKRYLLFDDVFTTGATLNACAKALRQAGAKEIDIATLCHG